MVPDVPVWRLVLAAVVLWVVVLVTFLPKLVVLVGWVLPCAVGSWVLPVPYGRRLRASAMEPARCTERLHVRLRSWLLWGERS